MFNARAIFTRGLNNFTLLTFGYRIIPTKPVEPPIDPPVDPPVTPTRPKAVDDSSAHIGKISLRVPVDFPVSERTACGFNTVITFVKPISSKFDAEFGFIKPIERRIKTCIQFAERFVETNKFEIIVAERLNYVHKIEAKKDYLPFKVKLMAMANLLQKRKKIT